MHTPSLSSSDDELQSQTLEEPSLTFVPALEPDPSLPDMGASAHLPTLDVYAHATDIDPLLARAVLMPQDVDMALLSSLGFSALDIQSGIAARGALAPAIQHPDLTVPLPSRDDGRPGDLDPSALDVLHATASYQQVAPHSYPEVWMDQRGVNSARTRHLTLLDDGLPS